MLEEKGFHSKPPFIPVRKGHKGITIKYVEPPRSLEDVERMTDIKILSLPRKEKITSAPLEVKGV